jgi:hypothetical protein
MSLTFDATPTGVNLHQVQRPISQQMIQGGTEAVEVATNWNAWQVSAVKQVIELEKLPPNWNSYGGLPPTSIATAGAKELLYGVPLTVPFIYVSPPRIVPISGGVQFEWKKGRRELEVAFMPDGSLECVKVEEGKVIAEEPTFPTMRIAEILPLLSWLVAA